MLEAAKLERVEYAIVLPEGRIAIQVNKVSEKLGHRAALAVMNGYPYEMEYLGSFIRALESCGALSYASDGCIRQFNLLKGMSDELGS